MRWVCYVGAWGMCGGRCGAVRRCPGKRAVWRGCGVRRIVGGCRRQRCRLCARFGFWLVELACGVRSFQGWCRCGEGWGAEPAWRGVVPVLVGCGVSRPRVGEGGGVWHVGAGLRDGLPAAGRGHRVQVRWGGWSLVAAPRAVWGSRVRSPGRPSGVFQYVGRAGSSWCGAWGILGRVVRDRSVANRGMWLRGTWGRRPTSEWAQWCRERCSWATRGLPR